VRRAAGKPGEPARAGRGQIGWEAGGKQGKGKLDRAEEPGIPARVGVGRWDCRIWGRSGKRVRAGCRSGCRRGEVGS